jgi:hypothetical protein
VFIIEHYLHVQGEFQETCFNFLVSRKTTTARLVDHFNESGRVDMPGLRDF